MSLYWLEAERRHMEVDAGRETYTEHLAFAQRCQRLSSVLSQIAPEERSRFFTTPELESINASAYYTVKGVDPNTFDLTVSDPRHDSPTALLARIFLPALRVGHPLPDERQVTADLELIRLFEAGLVKQPDLGQEPDAKTILYPRVMALPPTIRFYQLGRSFDHRTHTFRFAETDHHVLVPVKVEPSSLPIASHTQMLETVTQIEHLYTSRDTAHHCIADLKNSYSQLSFIDTAGDWTEIDYRRSVLQVGGGTDDHDLTPLLIKTLDKTTAGEVYYERIGTAIIRFCITRK